MLSSGVLRQQFRLMEGWLAPLAKHTQQQSHEMDQLRESMSQNPAAYQRLITLLEEAASKDEAMYDKLAKHKIAVREAGRKAKPRGKGE